MLKNIKNSLFVKILGISISVLIMAYICFQAWNGFKDVLSSKEEINWVYLLLTIPIYIIVTINSGILWAIIAKIFNIPGEFHSHLIIYLSTLAGRRLPGPYMNVVGRMALYKRSGVDVKTSGFASGIEILMVVWTGVQVILISGILIFFTKNTQYILLIIGLLLLSVLFHPKIIQFLYGKICKTDQLLNVTPAQIILLWAGYIIQWILGTGFQLVILKSILNIDISFFFRMMNAWAVSGVSGVVIGILPSGLGVSDASLSVVLAQSIPLATASLLALLSRLLFTVYDLLMSLSVIVLFRYINPKELLMKAN